MWASTTPVTVWKDSPANIERNNKAAAALMAGHGVAIDDLHAYVSPNVKAWQSGDKCHFNKLGNAELAKRVSQSISESLGSNKDKSRKPSP
jgi:lysophospholipase L1-like esterase